MRTALPQTTNRHAPASPHSSAQSRHLLGIRKRKVSERPSRIPPKMSVGFVVIMIILPPPPLPMDMTAMKRMMSRNQ
eukprot:scaffold22329_cov46-Skeletonema_menzelii.AAC.1